MKRVDTAKVYRAYDSYKSGKKAALDDIVGLITPAVKDTSFLDDLSRVIERNALFYAGIQHIEYIDSIKSYREIPTNKYNDYIPRSTTNYLYPIINTLTSMFTRNNPSCKVVENSDDGEAKSRARVGKRLVDAKWEEDREQENLAYAVKVALLAGTIYRKDYWDETGTAQVEIPQSDGTVKTLPLGDNAVSFLTPMEIIPDVKFAIRHLDDGQYVLEHTVHSVPTLIDQFNLDKPGYTGFAKDIKEDATLTNKQDVFERLKGVVGGRVGDTPNMEECASKIEAYIKPDSKHKKGLMIVIAGDKVVYIDECKYTYGNGKNWNPYTMFRFDLDPFRHHGRSLAEYIVPLQQRYNSIRSLILLNRKRNVSPQLLIPKNSVDQNCYINGEPGLNIEYNADIGKPEYLRGSDLSQGVYKELEDTKMEIFQISGNNEVMSGTQPSGVSTATALQILLEQSKTKFSTNIMYLDKYIEEFNTKKLNLWKKFYKEPRASLNGRMKAMNVENEIVEIDDFFKGKDLGDNLTVRIEGGSTLPISLVVEQNNMKELLALGAYGDISPDVNPQGNHEFLEKFRAPKLTNRTNVDVRKANWENDALRQSKFDKVTVLPTDNSVIHFNVVKKEINKPEFDTSNKPEVVEAFLRHLCEHFVRIDPQGYELAGITPLMAQELSMECEARGLYAPGVAPNLTQRVEQLEATLQEATAYLSEMTGAAEGGAPAQAVDMGGGPNMEMPPEEMMGGMEQGPPVMA